MFKPSQTISIVVLEFWIFVLRCRPLVQAALQSRGVALPGSASDAGTIIIWIQDHHFLNPNSLHIWINWGTEVCAQDVFGRAGGWGILGNFMGVRTSVNFHQAEESHSVNWAPASRRFSAMAVEVPSTSNHRISTYFSWTSSKLQPVWSPNT